jgi:protein gp37
MSDKTRISWADATWNPTVGCTKVSPGCDHCYAETFVNRFAGSKGFPLPFDQMHLREQRFLDLPLRWRTPKRIFVNSLSDLFHQDVPDEFLCRVFDVMLTAKWHTFQVLTKRHARMRTFVTRYLSGGFATQPLDATPLIWTVDKPPPNIWLGVSVEDQQWADIRIPVLLDTPAALRWISAEPLLGPLHLHRHLQRSSSPTLDWVVVGGESGHGARPMHPRWPRDIRDQCATAGTPFHFKQWGEWQDGSTTGHTTARDHVIVHDGRHEPVHDHFRPDRSTAPLSDLARARYLGTRGAEHGAWISRVGVKAAGRELDGRTHDSYPTGAAHV